jgi:hypothetical protein
MSIPTCPTLSFSGPPVQGWPSFYSFCPDWMQGMNSYFYTWSGGNLYRHNTNDIRNNYYGVQYNSTITGVFNTEPQTIKLFKTMSLESDSAWSVTNLVTDLSTGSMLSAYFEEKEGEWFSFIRSNAGAIDWRLRSANGIGDNINVTGPLNATVITFSVPDSPGYIIQAGSAATGTGGDDAYYNNGGVPVLIGRVTAVNNSSVVGASTITVDATGNAQPPIGSFILYIKNSVAESHGARGYFLEFTIENTATTAVELFAVCSSVMKRFP